MKRWVKVSIGEGVEDWVDATHLYADLEWNDIIKHGYMPTHVGQEPPKEE